MQGGWARCEFFLCVIPSEGARLWRWRQHVVTQFQTQITGWTVIVVRTSDLPQTLMSTRTVVWEKGGGVLCRFYLNFMLERPGVIVQLVSCMGLKPFQLLHDSLLIEVCLFYIVWKYFVLRLQSYASEVADTLVACQVKCPPALSKSVKWLNSYS